MIDNVDGIGPDQATVRLRNPVTGHELLIFGKVLNISARDLGFDCDGVLDVERLNPSDVKELNVGILFRFAPVGR